jgi:hypothetical protein
MQPVDNQVRDQAKLSFASSFEFCLSSIRYRYARSAVTLAVIVLAVAFLMNILTEGIIGKSVARAVDNEFSRLYVLDLFAGRVSKKTVSVASLSKELSRLQPSQPRWKELEAWHGKGAGNFAALAGLARQEASYTAFLDEMDFGRKRKLVKRNEGAAMFEYLKDPAAFEQFARDLKTPEMLTLRFPETADAMIEFVRMWASYRAELEQLKNACHAAIAAAETELGLPIEAALDAAVRSGGPERDGKCQQLLTVLRKAGFQLETAELNAVCEDRRILNTLDTFRKYVLDPEFRNKWGHLKLQADFNPETLLQHYEDKPAVRAWVNTIAEHITKRRAAPLPCSREELLAVSAKIRKLVEAAGKTDFKIADPEMNLSDQQKDLVAYFSDPAFRDSWATLGLPDEFSVENLVWHYSPTGKIGEWVGAQAAKLAKKIPCNRQEIKNLADTFHLRAERRGLKQLDLARADLLPKEQKLIDYLQDPAFKVRWDELNANFDFSPAAVVLCYAGEDCSLRVQSWIGDISKRIAGRTTDPLPCSESEILEIARLAKERTRVRTLSSEIVRHGGSAEALGERTFWLIVVSFIVCVVGIANAMLMAVTERFREIATMKCLGALDGFIMTIFLIESGLQGLLGAILGVVLGLLLAVIRCGNSYGIYTLTHFPVGDVSLNVLASTAAGMLLAMLAAVYPAWVASRMAPMEAMRVE